MNHDTNIYNKTKHTDISKHNKLHTQHTHRQQTQDTKQQHKTHHESSAYQTQYIIILDNNETHKTQTANNTNTHKTKTRNTYKISKVHTHKTKQTHTITTNNQHLNIQNINIKTTQTTSKT